MEPDPHASPRSTLSRHPRPWTVKALVVYFALGGLLPAAGMAWKAAAGEAPVAGVVWAILLIILGDSVFCYALYAGHRWARTVALVLACFAMLKAAFGIVLAGFRLGGVPDLLGMLLYVAPLAALLALLMASPTREWYSDARQ